MMGPPEGASEYLNLYDSLCDARAASGEEYAGLIPRGADSEEKVLRWHLRRRHVTADPWLLFNFVFYRVRSEFPFEVSLFWLFWLFWLFFGYFGYRTYGQLD
jgi:hypothetical protein